MQTAPQSKCKLRLKANADCASARFKANATADRSAAVFFEELFRFQRGHAAGAGSGDGLTVAAVLDVAAGKDAGDGLAIVRREDIAVGEDVAVGIQIELAVKHLRVGDVADAEEHE